MNNPESRIPQVDAYLGSDLGLWFLSNVDTSNIKQVITNSDQIAAEAHQKGLPVLFGNIRDLTIKNAEVAFSVHYPYILSATILSCYQGKAYNIHPGYLPWGRGYFPIFWALWEETPAGATLHAMSAQVDRGPVVDQIAVDYSAEDTGGSLFQRVRLAEKKLITHWWDKIRAGDELATHQQPPLAGTYHSRYEFDMLKNSVQLETISAAKLVKLIRCLSFPGYTGLEVLCGTRKYHITMQRVEHDRAK